MKQGIGLFLLSLISSIAGSQVDYASFVNPFVGTGGHGHTFPGATVPYGMVQLSPDTRIDGSWDGCSGYHFSDSTIYGFSHTHLSGTGVSDYGDVLLMPFTGKPSLENNVYRSGFSHKNEIAQPGFYEIFLNDDKIRARMTATAHCGFHQYIFSTGKKGNIILDLAHRDKLISSSIEEVSSAVIEGHRVSNAWATNQHIYFVIEFSSPYKVVNRKENEKVCLQFDIRKKKAVNIRIGISFTGIEGARKNLKAEIDHWDFERVREDARKMWNRELSRIEIKTSEEEQKKNFYTAFYHVMMHPNIAMDVDSMYRGMDGQLHKAEDHCHYTVFSLWDTFRAYHPLQTIIDKKRTTDFIRTFLLIYEQGGRLPVWELASNETDCMIGYHSVSVIADALAKGIRDFDKEQALTAMVKSATWDHLGIPAYMDHGFLSMEDEHESVSKTLEYAYDDWCIAQVAEMMNENSVYKKFIQRSQNWKNLFDGESGFIRPKKNGGWMEPFDPKEVNNNYTEANGWQYTFFVPHDIDGLISAMGGDDKFEKKLDELFTTTSQTTGREQVDITGLIGQYAHGNEPSHHMAYLYNYINKPWKTQEIVHRILYDFYKQHPDGLIGNEDCGQMSAWYMMSAMGIYQVVPGATFYAVGCPVFDETTIHLENGKSFIIRSENAGINNKYIQSIVLNGTVKDRYFIHHFDIEKGGQLYIEMGNNIPGSERINRFNVPIAVPSALRIVPVPVIHSSQQVFKDSLLVKMTSQNSADKIFYSSDGSIPDENSIEYTAPFYLHQSSVIKAVTVNEKGRASLIMSAAFYRVMHNRKVMLKNRYNPQYSAGGDDGIIDGIKGDKNWRKGNWQGYQYKDFEAVIDLGREEVIKKVSSRFLQDTRSWIIFPGSVEFFISSNGKDFESFGEIKCDIPANEYTIMIKEFSFIPDKVVSGRYLKIYAKNFGELPSWHQGSGDGAFIFVDEVMIE